MRWTRQRRARKGHRRAGDKPVSDRATCGRPALNRLREIFGETGTKLVERLFRVAARTAKSCGPDAPTLASSVAEALPPNRVGRRLISARRRWQKSPVTGESTKEAVKTIAQGRPDDRPHLWFLPLCFLIAQGAMGASWHPAFPAPSQLARRNSMQRLGRVARRECGIVSGPMRCGRRG
jgi:hypothetical protein